MLRSYGRPPSALAKRWYGHQRPSTNLPRCPTQRTIQIFVDEHAESYLSEVLRKMDGFRAVTVPGDGNCLTHAASRCILGIEILYHTLRKEIRAELTRNMAWYQKHVFAMYEDETSEM